MNLILELEACLREFDQHRTGDRLRKLVWDLRSAGVGFEEAQRSRVKAELERKANVVSGLEPEPEGEPDVEPEKPEA